MSKPEINIKMPPSYRLAAFDCLDSTNSEITRQLSDNKGLDENLVVWAQTQTAGRGRRNRTWVSQSGNLFFSILKRPNRSLQEWAQVSFAISLGLYEGINEVLSMTNHTLHCKWPNDLLVDHQKICGILLETQNIQSPDHASLIIGIGINITSHPDPALYPATSLEKCLQTQQKPEQILEILLPHIDLWFRKWEEGGFASIRDEWIKRAKGIGQEITVHLENEKISGRFDGLDEHGNLILESPVGQRKISAGDVFFN